MRVRKIRICFLVAMVLTLCFIVGGVMTNTMAAEEKIRIGVPLTYGPQNQPLQVMAAHILNRLEELGAQPVALRGSPSSESTLSVCRRLLQMNIKSLVVGIYPNRSESMGLAKEAHEKGVKTVGWGGTNIVDSPFITDDMWGNALNVGKKLYVFTQGEGGILHTNESKGFFPPADIMDNLFEVFMKYQPRMKLYPFIDGGVSTQDEIALSRNNFAAVFKANPKKGAFKGIVSWWWPNTIGAIQAMREQGRDKEGIGVFSTFVAKTLLTEMVRADTPLVGTMDIDCKAMGVTIAEYLYRLAKGENLSEEIVIWIPYKWIPRDQAKAALDNFNKEIEWTQKKLKEYGG
jgi:ABC-type sugar transport system substrate-binding protein